jgi:hypothetical protein
MIFRAIKDLVKTISPFVEGLGRNSRLEISPSPLIGLKHLPQGTISIGHPAMHKVFRAGLGNTVVHGPIPRLHEKDAKLWQPMPVNVGCGMTKCLNPNVSLCRSVLCWNVTPDFADKAVRKELRID